MFWGSQKLHVHFQLCGGAGTPPNPYVVQVSIVYTLRLYLVLNSVFAPVELQTALQIKRKKLSATRRKDWFPILDTGTSSLCKIYSRKFQSFVKLTATSNCPSVKEKLFIQDLKPIF